MTFKKMLKIQEKEIKQINYKKSKYLSKTKVKTMKYLYQLMMMKLK